MSRRWVAAIAAVVVVVAAAVLLTRDWVESAAVVPPANTSHPASSPPPATPASTPSTAPTPKPSASRPPATPPTRATGAPRLAWAAFLARVNEDRATVGALNAALQTAAQAQDPVAVRRAAVDILDFVDSERDWLRDNPPADCYADAHASAGAMLDAYGTAADAFVTWAQTGGGIAGLGALSAAVDAAQTASDALTTFGQVLGATACPA